MSKEIKLTDEEIEKFAKFCEDYLDIEQDTVYSYGGDSERITLVLYIPGKSRVVLGSCEIDIEECECDND